MNARQPVHTVYGGAHLFRADSAARLGAAALASLDAYAPDHAAFAAAIGIGPGRSLDLYARIRRKLREEPVEDYRIDFEDGYGARSAADEDRDADRTAREVAAGARAGTLPPFIGIRIKGVGGETRGRGLRTLERFVSTLVREASPGSPTAPLPPNFVVTLAKVTAADQVRVLVDAIETLERALDLAPARLMIEVMVESPRLIVDPAGRSGLPALVEAAAGRLRGAHFGPYDYTAALGITAEHQSLRHGACAFARQAMQAAFAETGVWLADGPTMLMPVPVHRPRGGGSLTAIEREENTAGVHRAWRRHYEDARASLIDGFYQGWDLHPAQLPTRFAAVDAFFLDGLETAGARLRHFLDQAARATLHGGVFDDAATGQGLLNYFLRAAGAGAVTDAEILAATGLTTEAMRTRSFADLIGAPASV